MSDAPHDHDRPGHRRHAGRLATTRAILNGASHATTHQAAEGGSCPACTASAAASLGVALASTLAGDTGFTSEPVRQALLAALDAAEGELGGAPN